MSINFHSSEDKDKQLKDFVTKHRHIYCYSLTDYEAYKDIQNLKFKYTAVNIYTLISLLSHFNDNEEIDINLNKFKSIVVNDEIKDY